MDIVALIEQGIGEMALPMPAGSAERLARFLELLKKWNRAQNLTAVTEPEAMVARHVLDSLSGAPRVRGRQVLDIGSGAGLPGIPLAVADPLRQMILLDSRHKRVQFLTHAKQVLGLDNVTVVHARIEKYQPGRKFDTLTARAFAALTELIRLAMPFVAAGTRLVAWQGKDPTAVLEQALAGQAVCHAVHPVRVPGIGAQRHIVVLERRELVGSETVCPA
ncbi:MAG: Ribosomal RNA small subunit methyltransferase G [Gammaproteobacteria bacterium]|nr:Ribosomal RNA small subunit methyltransferase G [Gammaproteobacteria bacterium]